jgi:hypothetical protein
MGEMPLGVAMTAIGILAARVAEARATRQAHVYVADLTPEVNSVSLRDAARIMCQIAGATVQAIEKTSDTMDPGVLYLEKE